MVVWGRGLCGELGRAAASWTRFEGRIRRIGWAPLRVGECMCGSWAWTCAQSMAAFACADRRRLVFFSFLRCHAYGLYDP